MEEMLHHEELLNTDAKNHLVKAGFWAKIVGIIGIIFSMIMALFSLFIMFGYSTLLNLTKNGQDDMLTPSPFILILSGLMYLVMALVYFFMSWGAYKFGTTIKSGLHHHNESSLAVSFKNLNLFFTVYGVLLLIAVFFMILALIFIAFAGSLMV